MACAGEQSAASAFELIRKAGPMAELAPADFDACLAFLAGELAAPAGAFEPEPGAAPRWTAPRVWKHAGRFGIRSRRVVRWFRNNVGTICSEESVRVLEQGAAVGTLEASYAERLAPGDRFVLDGRALEVHRLEAAILQEAQLQRGYLRDAHMQGASLYEAQLQGANLAGADLQDVDFSGAQLQRASSGFGRSRSLPPT